MTTSRQVGLVRIYLVWWSWLKQAPLHQRDEITTLLSSASPTYRHEGYDDVCFSISLIPYSLYLSLSSLLSLSINIYIYIYYWICGLFRLWEYHVFFRIDRYFISLFAGTGMKSSKLAYNYRQ